MVWAVREGPREEPWRETHQVSPIWPCSVHVTLPPHQWAPKGLVDARSHRTHLLAQAPRQDNHTTDCPALGSPADPGPYSQPGLSSSPFKHHSKERDPGTQSHRGCSWTLTLIMLQEPVSPHVPHLHGVVHAGGSNARAAGVEVHVGDEAGKTGPPHTVGSLRWLRTDPETPSTVPPLHLYSRCPSAQNASLPPCFFTRWPRESKKERMRAVTIVTQEDSPGGKSQHPLLHINTRKPSSDQRSAGYRGFQR